MLWTALGSKGAALDFSIVKLSLGLRTYREYCPQ